MEMMLIIAGGIVIAVIAIWLLQFVFYFAVMIAGYFVFGAVCLWTFIIFCIATSFVKLSEKIKEIKRKYLNQEKSRTVPTNRMTEFEERDHQGNAAKPR
jgi:polyferredoxin